MNNKNKPVLRLIKGFLSDGSTEREELENWHGKSRCIWLDRNGLIHFSIHSDHVPGIVSYRCTPSYSTNKSKRWHFDCCVTMNSFYHFHERTLVSILPAEATLDDVCNELSSLNFNDLKISEEPMQFKPMNPYYAQYHYFPLRNTMVKHF